MLRCRDGSLYTGWTSDLDRRMARHQAGKASRYTASRLPVELALALPMADRTAARREEARIKMLPRVHKLALIDTSRGLSHAVSVPSNCPADHANGANAGGHDRGCRAYASDHSRADGDLAARPADTPMHVEDSRLRRHQ